ncbi:hypothetical protein Tco_1149318, partial [Tanacetum coccineum]
AMLKAGYENGNMVDLYAEQFDYDVMSFINSEANVENDNIENVDFQTEADDNVVIKDFSTHDGFLNKLCTTRAVFRGSTSRQQVDDIPEEDPQNDEIDVVFKIKKGVNYPTFDPTIPWDKMEPILGMKYEKVKKVKKSNKGVQVKNMILRSSVNAQNPSGEGTSQQASGCQSPKWDWLHKYMWNNNWHRMKKFLENSWKRKQGRKKNMQGGVEKKKSGRLRWIGHIQCIRLKMPTNEDVAANEDVKGKAPVDEGSNVATTPSKKRNRQKWMDQSDVEIKKIDVDNMMEKCFILNKNLKVAW